MDPGGQNVEILYSFLRHLTRMRDEEVKAEEEVISLVLERLVSIVHIEPVALSGRRSKRAEDILNPIYDNLVHIKRFFRSDQGKLIRAIRRENRDDPRMYILTLDIEGASITEAKFLRTLCCRQIALEKRASARRTSQYLTYAGLPQDDKSRNSLKHGDKCLRIEEGTGLPEITLVLAPAYSAIDYLFSHEEKRLIGLLNHGMYPEITRTARDLWGQLQDYQSIFDRQISTLYPIIQWQSI
jgi:hypothetical protein